MTNSIRGNKESQLRRKPTSGINAMLNGKSLTKQMPFGDVSIVAEYVVIKAEDVKEKTTAHALNRRAQEALSLEAVADILPSIQDEGIKQEGVAVFNNKTNKYELIDSSRRRFCAIEAKKDLPLWVLVTSPTPKQIADYVSQTQLVKFFSWREDGFWYLEQAKAAELAANDFSGIGKIVNKSGETVRKKIQAANVNEFLISIFPDREGIPTKFYSELAKVEKKLVKHSQSIPVFASECASSFATESTDVSNVQNELLQHLIIQADSLGGKPKPKSGRKTELAEFADKDKFARISISANGNRAKIDLSRIGKADMDAIEAFIVNQLKRDKTE